MIRRGWCVAAVVLVLAGCSGDDDDAGGPPTTAADRPPATLPAEVDAGRGALVLDGEAAVLTVTACTLTPATDPATGVTTELSITAEDGTGRLVEVTRSSFDADIPTTTDSVDVTDVDGTVLSASRASRQGRAIDLRDADAAGPLLDVDTAAGVVRAEGIFGPIGSLQDDPANVDGSLLLRCPA